MALRYVYVCNHTHVYTHREQLGWKFEFKGLKSQHLWIFLLESISTISAEQAAQGKRLDFAGINSCFAYLIFLFSVLSNNRDAERDGEFYPKSQFPLLQQVLSPRSRTVWINNTPISVAPFKWWVSSHNPTTCQMIKNGLANTLQSSVFLELSSKLLDISLLLQLYIFTQ